MTQENGHSDLGSAIADKTYKVGKVCVLDLLWF